MGSRTVIVRRLAAVPVAVVMLLVAGGCGGELPFVGRDAVATYVPPNEADLRYGAEPRRHPDVTYQPDVVIVRGGGGAVRSVTDDGLTWRIDPSAPGAEELAEGKVMFVTGRGVGRVLDLRRAGEDLAVTIGPVAITEVIRDGSFGSDEEISFDNVVTYQAGQPFWTVAPGEHAEGGGGGGGGSSADVAVEPLAATAAALALPAAPAGLALPAAPAGLALPAAPAVPGPADRATQPAPSRGGAGPVSADGLTVSPVCCAAGAGVRFTYDKGGVLLLGEAAFIWERPRGRFNLDIDGASITTATFQITGGAGIRLKIEGGSKLGAGHNVDPVIKLPVDFTVPLGTFLGVPFSATVNQSLNITTAFSAKNGNIKAEGEWSLSGTFGFGYVDGSFRLLKPQLVANEKILDSIESISIGVNGLFLVYQARFRVGIGALGFNTGLYAGLTINAGLTAGSAAGAPIAFCRSAQVDLWLNYGIGYRIPRAVADVINLFLRVFDARPINHEGGIGSTEHLFTDYKVEPKKAICQA